MTVMRKYFFILLLCSSAMMAQNTYSDYQAILMEVVKGDDTKPIIWDEYKKIIADNFDKPNIKEMERQEFYKYSHKCFAIIQTGK